MASDAPAKDQGEFVGLTDSAIGVEQPLLNAGVLSLLGSEKGRETGQPFLSTVDQIVGDETIGESLQGRSEHCKKAFAHCRKRMSRSHRQPIMLIETDASGEGEISPAPVTR